MRLIPELIDLPEVVIEPAAITLYYSILYHGSLLLKNDVGRLDGQLPKRIYGLCLRALPTWLEHASGTKTDLVIAILIVCPREIDYSFRRAHDVQLTTGVR